MIKVVKPWQKIVVLLFTAIGLSACGSSPKTRFYTLAAANQLESNTQHSVQSLGVGPIELPEMLDQLGVVSQQQNHEITVASYHVWAGDLNEAFARVLADNLSNLLGIDGVWPFPWDNRVRPQRQVRVHVEQFSGQRGGVITLRAKWSLLNQNASQVLSNHRQTFTQTAKNGSYSTYVATLNQLVTELSHAIAESFQQLP